MKIFIDDDRMPQEPGDWVIARDPQTAFGLIHANSPWITHLSFDHNLDHQVTGLDILTQMFGTEYLQPDILPRLVEICMHSSDSKANAQMRNVAQAAKDSGILRTDVEIVNRSALYTQYHTFASWYDDAYETEKERLGALRSR